MSWKKPLTRSTTNVSVLNTKFESLTPPILPVQAGDRCSLFALRTIVASLKANSQRLAAGGAIRALPYSPVSRALIFHGNRIAHRKDELVTARTLPMKALDDIDYYHPD